MAFGHRVVRPQRNGLRIGEFGASLSDVLGDVDQDRPRAPGRGKVERLLDRDRQILGILHQEVVLHARSGDADGVAFLKGILTDGMRGYLAREDHQRHGVHVGRGDSRNGVGHPGARRYERNPDFVR